MSKQDALNAINSTIIKNNKKGITADSLRNVLTEMVEASGEDGSGLLTVKLPDPMFWFAYFVLCGEFNPITIEEALASEELSEDDEECRKIWLGYIEHNKQVFQTIMANAEQCKPTALILDCSESYKNTYNAFADGFGIGGGAESLSVSTLATAIAGEVYESDVDDFVKTVAISEIASGNKRLFTDGMIFSDPTDSEITMYLAEDGSVKFEMAVMDGSVVPLIHIPISGELNEDELAQNKKLADYYCYTNTNPPNPAVIKVEIHKDGSAVIGHSVTLLNTQRQGNIFYVTYIDSLECYEVAISAIDGATTVTKIGTLNAVSL